MEKKDPACSYVMKQNYLSSQTVSALKTEKMDIYKDAITSVSVFIISCL